jgi:hypothetical protein
MHLANTYRTRLTASAALGAVMCIAPFVAGLSRFGPMYAMVGVLAVGVAVLFASAGGGSVARGRIGWVAFWLVVALFSAAESVYYFAAGFSDDDPVIALDAMTVLVFGLAALLTAGSRIPGREDEDAAG